MSKTQIRIGDALSEVRIPPLGEGQVGKLALVFVKVMEADGEWGWAVRASDELDEDEILGVLVGYTHHLRKRAAASWVDHE